MTTPCIAVSGRRALLDVFDADPFVFAFASESATGLASHDAAVWQRPLHGSVQLVAYGEPHAAAELLTRFAPERLPARLATPRPILETVPDWLRPARFGEWLWFYTRQAPPRQDGEDRANWCQPEEYAEVNALLDVAFPTASARPDSATSWRRWYAIRDTDGTMVACGNAAIADGAGPSLGSIAVHPDARRRGLGSALTAWVTRQLMAEGHPQVSLGSYTGEDATHRVYRRLGFQDRHVMTTGRVEPEPT